MTVAGIFAVVLALIHICAGRFRVLSYIPRSTWYSVAGGIAAAYVFVHLLPELAEMHDEVAGESQALLLYLVTLVGLLSFYGLEKLAQTAGEAAQSGSTNKVFWLHIISFGVYNSIVGYTLADKAESPRDLTHFFIAMAVHFYANDVALWTHYKENYDRYGRWILGLGIAGGWIMGVNELLPTIAIGMAFAFLVGGIILNVLKEEMPDERKSNFLALAGSAAAYAALVLFT